MSLVSHQTLGHHNPHRVHTATARNGAWDVLIPVNTKRNVVLKDEGTVDYYCKFHPNMRVRFWLANEAAEPKSLARREILGEFGNVFLTEYGEPFRRRTI